MRGARSHQCMPVDQAVVSDEGAHNVMTPAPHAFKAACTPGGAHAAWCAPPLVRRADGSHAAWLARSLARGGFHQTVQTGLLRMRDDDIVTCQPVRPCWRPPG